MIKWFKKNYTHYMIRPIIYKAVPRFLVGLVISLLWDRFINKSEMFTLTGYAFPVMGILFVCMAWFSFLGMDGMGFKKYMKPKSKKKEQTRSFSDMSDFVNTEVSFDELSDIEKSACNLAASLICSLVFFILSLF